MILNFSFQLIAGKEKFFCQFALFKTYRATCSAPANVLWGKLVDLADISWNPLLQGTNAPRGLLAKPGLIYQVVTRLTPFPVRVFVERVCPGELLSVRLLAIPGVENRVTYQVHSTLMGSYVSCSITLRGWLSPFLWWAVRPYAARVASALAEAAEGVEGVII